MIKGAECLVVLGAMALGGVTAGATGVWQEKCSTAPYSSTINLSFDLIGTPDQRGGTWGNAAAYAAKAHFKALPGCQTRILHVYGDFIAWPKSGSIASGKSLEVGFGMKTTAPDGSSTIDYPGYSATPYDNSFVWVQAPLTDQMGSARIPLNVETRDSGLLRPDNILLLQAFLAIDSTGLTIHMEPTVTVVYQFEKAAQ